ncbi:MAG: glucokinase, partial [Candidatus Manganitrophaceae bacterium]
MEKRRRRTSHPVDLILAGDLGGTKTHLALFRERKKELIPIREQLFPSQKYQNLEEIVLEFLAEERAPVGRACFGVAGPVIAGRGRITNLPWMVDAVALRGTFGIPSVRLLNDVEATAYGALALTGEDLFTLHPGDPDLWGNQALIAAGTGLGEALLIWDGVRYLPLASEGGHSDFAPRNGIEIELLEYLLGQFPTVSYERVLSGPGL